ncbi:unnamed protein product [Camellia sinensis]
MKPLFFNLSPKCKSNFAHISLFLSLSVTKKTEEINRLFLKLEYITLSLSLNTHTSVSLSLSLTLDPYTHTFLHRSSICTCDFEAISKIQIDFEIQSDFEAPSPTSSAPARWSKIARRLPGRTDNEIKNYWRSHLRKNAQVREQETTIRASQTTRNKMCWLQNLIMETAHLLRRTF